MNILQRMLIAARDAELAGVKITKLVVSSAGHDALVAYRDDFWKPGSPPSDIDFTKFVLGVPVDRDPEQTIEFTFVGVKQ